MRALRPGLSRIVGSLFQVTFVALIFAVVNGEHFTSYYLFYGSLAFALLYISSLRALYERVTGAILRAAGYRRRAVLVGTGKHIPEVARALSYSPSAISQRASSGSRWRADARYNRTRGDGSSLARDESFDKAEDGDGGGDEEPEDERWVLDFGEWASVYRTWLARQAEYRNEVQRIQRHTPGLAGLIRVAV